MDSEKWNRQFSQTDSWGQNVQKSSLSKHFYCSYTTCVQTILNVFLVLFRRSLVLTLHLLFAKFLRICRLTDSWMFLQRAVSPAILESKTKKSKPCNFLHVQWCPLLSSHLSSSLKKHFDLLQSVSIPYGLQSFCFPIFFKLLCSVKAC